MGQCGMRAIWTGSISFGLVNVPVKLYGATESHDIAFHQVHDEDGGRIRYERHCEKCGEQVEFGHIDKAYDDGEKTVVMDDKEFETLPVAVKDEVEVVQFVPAGQIDPIMLEKAYYLEPVGKSPKSYLLLRQTLEQAELTAVVRFSLRERTRLGVLRTSGEVMVLQGLLWGDEVRAADFPAVSASAKVSDAELKMSAALVEQFAGDFDPSQFSDDYQEQLRELIDAKLEQGDAVDTAATFGDAGADEGKGAEVVDLMDALKRSLERGRGGSAASSGPAGGSGKGSASKAGSAKRGTAKDAEAETDAAEGDAEPAETKAGSAKARGAKGSQASGAAKSSSAKSSSAKSTSSDSKSRTSKDAAAEGDAAKGRVSGGSPRKRAAS